MRVSRFERQGFQQELHRYAQATFHEGSHRQAPGDSTPWRDVSSPINRFRGWWLAPTAKGSILAAWTVTLVLGAYCFSLQQDANGTYLLNNVLLRSLHEEARRADANAQRVKELQAVVQQQLSSPTKARGGWFRWYSTATSTSHTAVNAPTSSGTAVTNHELEIVRERTRAEQMGERNTRLVAALIAVRGELGQAQKCSEALQKDVENLRQVIRQQTVG